MFACKSMRNPGEVTHFLVKRSRQTFKWRLASNVDNRDAALLTQKARQANVGPVVTTSGVSRSYSSSGGSQQQSRQAATQRALWLFAAALYSKTLLSCSIAPLHAFQEASIPLMVT